MLKCKDVPEQTDAYLAGELSFLKRLEFKLHTFICGPCRDYVKKLRLITEALPNLKGNKPCCDVDDNYIDDIISKANDEKH